MSNLNNNQAGKGNRKHRNVSTSEFRDGWDEINWDSKKKAEQKKQKKKLWQTKLQLL